MSRLFFLVLFILCATDIQAQVKSCLEVYQPVTVRFKKQRIRAKTKNFELIKKIKSKKTGRTGFVVRYKGRKGLVVPKENEYQLYEAETCAAYEPLEGLNAENLTEDPQQPQQKEREAKKKSEPQNSSQEETLLADDEVEEKEDKQKITRSSPEEAAPSEEKQEIEPPTAPKSDSDRRSKWGVEVSLAQSINTSALENIVFPRNRYPLPSDNANEPNFDPPFDNISVPDPFVDSIEEGEGFQITLFYEHGLLGSWLRQKWGLGYWSREFIAETYPVPNTPSFNAVNNLQRQDVTFSFQAISFRPETRILLSTGRFSKLSLNLGLQIDYVTNEQSLEIRTGLNDLVATTVQTGYNTIEFHYFPRIEYELYGFRIGVEFMDPHESFAPTFVLGFATSL
ncbi:MAG: hypothetical protein AAF203_02025 [Pseudomonadota bacterium]